MLQIPKTSKSKYLTKYVALNILNDTPTGDWHPHILNCDFNDDDQNRYLAGDGMPLNTNEYLGDTGIIDVSLFLKSMGFYDKCVTDKANPVYAANHARACFDWLICVIQENAPLNSIILDDWFPNKKLKLMVYDLLDIAYNKLPESYKIKVDEWKRNNPCED